MRFHMLVWLLIGCFSGILVGENEPAKDVQVAKEKPAAPEVPAELKAALEKLKLPGVKINLEEWSVDVEGKICLTSGLLELVVCTKDTKEHESIVVIDAKPSHVHTALLLLGARPGSPARMEQLDGGDVPRFRHFRPHGGPVDVSLVIKGADGKETETPISEFIMEAERDQIPGEAQEKHARKKFPTNTFLFAGSVLYAEGDGPRQYLCDSSGNVISLTTFGDELLCLPDIFETSNEALMWQINEERMPGLDTKVIVRLRPQVKR